ncbi:unnamed protein product [Cylicocyclus nassatus]|uniref:Uncharacterized protein n=1 Tax=Cylicocyclus nassatus TaxID=53992 RepID=A0AA36GSQ6_CYLNA|nr:unnamed protein product [Cylicocyclus nassatus]
MLQKCHNVTDVTRATKVTAACCPQFEIISLAVSFVRDPADRLLSRPTAIDAKENDSPESSQGGGTVTESASDAIFCALLAARQWKINQVVEEQRRSGVVKYDTIHDIAKRLVVYCSKDAHSCIEKACKLAMLRCRPIQAKEENLWGITGEQIEERIEKDLKRDLILLHSLYTRNNSNRFL